MDSLSATLVRERSKSRGEPGWLAEARAEAYEAYRALEAPRYARTNLASLPIEALALHAAPAPTPKPTRQPGVLRLSLVDAAREHEDLVRPLLAPHPRADKWETLHRALWSGGAFVFVERNYEAAQPIVLDEPYARGGGIGHDVVVLDRLAKARLVTRTHGAGKGALVSHGASVALRDGANLQWSTLQEIDHGATLLSAKRVQIARDAKLSWVDGQFGAGTSVILNENVLAGPGAGLGFIGAFFGSAGQHMDITTSALHEGAHTESLLRMKGALNEDGYSSNSSIVNIGPHAPNSSGHQKQETLILSEGARADAIPKLDVENNDVSASHGASVGQVDPEQLFYLRSRGFSDLAAKRLIVEGFFEPLLAEIPIEDIRDSIRAALVGRLRE